MTTATVVETQNTNQNGDFYTTATFWVVIAIAIALVLAFLGWAMYHRANKKRGGNTTVTTTIRDSDGDMADCDSSGDEGESDIEAGPYSQARKQLLQKPKKPVTMQRVQHAGNADMSYGSQEVYYSYIEQEPVLEDVSLEASPQNGVIAGDHVIVATSSSDSCSSSDSDTDSVFDLEGLAMEEKYLKAKIDQQKGKLDRVRSATNSVGSMTPRSLVSDNSNTKIRKFYPEGKEHQKLVYAENP